MRSRRNPEAGLTMIEVMIAVALLLIVSAGLMGLFMTGITTTENQGHTSARSIEYAQDKMEQLMALAFADQNTDTRTFPATGQAAGSGNYGLTIGGSYDPAAPVDPYADYIDATGNVVASSAPYLFIRVWKVEYVKDSGGNNITTLKKITVSTKALKAAGQQAFLPQATLVCYKATGI